MNPETNEFEEVTSLLNDVYGDPEKKKELAEIDKELRSRLKESRKKRYVRQDGSPVPEHWAVFEVGEEVVVKGYVFRVGSIGKLHIVFEPVGEALEERDD